MNVFIVLLLLAVLGAVVIIISCMEQLTNELLLFVLCIKLELWAIVIFGINTIKNITLIKL